ncbi:MAG: cytochrome c family protein [candidate division KSB1 bacterium]|nr:cytochrome c family protein [candidate division KSB1 bacterium]MDZ7300702.1 cytochrome c family protein [candidate division KSB1 bacterium]MDZ7310028.1 cytochrome c family protein [candidate division KSB1 bacterium]
MNVLNNQLLTVFLSVAVLLTFSVFITSYTHNVKLPDNHQGYEPVQPISFSHRLHAGELGIACLHCHGAAEWSRAAGIPSSSVCMNCHKFVTAPWVEVKAESDLAEKEKRAPRLIISPELEKLYTAMGLNNELKPDVAKSPQPIAWVKVHHLPSFVYFNHSAHVNAGVECQTCHGAVETMERVRQVSDLSMGWCVNCHREANKNGIAGKKVYASTDCVVCHH